MFQSELFDTNNNFDSSTNYRYTTPVNGFYQFDATVLANSGTNNNNNIFLYKNGTQLYQGSTQTVPSGDCGLTISVLIQLAATDYIEIYWQTNFGSGMTLGYGSTPYKTYFSGYLVSQT